MLLFVKLCFRMAHHIFARLLMGKLGKQPLRDFKPFPQAGIYFVTAHLW